MFSKRRPVLIAVLGASAAAGIGGGIAVAATDENSSKITALSSPGPAAISALGVGPEIPSAKALRTSPATAKDPVARAMANATVIRSDERIRVALGRESHGPLVCMSIGAPGVDAGGSTRQPVTPKPATHREMVGQLVIHLGTRAGTRQRRSAGTSR